MVVAAAETEAAAAVVVAVTGVIAETEVAEEIIAAGVNNLLCPGGGKLFSACTPLVWVSAQSVGGNAANGQPLR